MSQAGPPSPTLIVADPDRRFHAFALDRGLSLLGQGGAGTLAWWLAGGRWWVVLAALLCTGLLLVAATAGLLARSGATPGKRLLGLRVLDPATARPLDPGAAWWRTVTLALAGVPTLGFGLAALSWTALADPSGRRRGWHDLRSGGVVVDVRPAPAPVQERVRPQPVVNLTALRLAPVVGAAAVPAAGVAPREVPTASRPMPGPPAPAPGPRGQWRLTLDTGDSLVVEGVVLLGRRPAARPGEVVRHLLPLASQDMSVSKTHAQVGPASDGTLVVMDRGSANGTHLLRRGVVRELPPGRPTTLVPGDRVRCGDREVLVSREG